MKKLFTLIIILSLHGLLAACNTAPSAPSAPSTPSESGRADAGASATSVPSEAETWASLSPEARRQRVIDILFNGLQALDDDRLLNPPRNNAHDYFRQVLTVEPDNPIALQGIQDIALRYTELAEREIRRGLFDEAEVLLSRAESVDASHPAIATARATLAAEQESGDLLFTLDANELARRSTKAITRLQDIAQQAKQHEAFFLITAPSDELARWIFMTMREAVTGYRLRGSIEIANRNSIRLRIPRDKND
ncbi:MAG: hypothetical protein ACR2PR_04155 [Pseudohongiellaceae bacterium]